MLVIAGDSIKDRASVFNGASDEALCRYLEENIFEVVFATLNRHCAAKFAIILQLAARLAVFLSEQDVNEGFFVVAKVERVVGA